MEDVDITQRQIEILRRIIEEYTHTGQPVGSELLEKKYKIGASPATIRNEMVVLAKKGYLSKSYFSSGRVPTAKAFRFYIKHLLEPQDLSTLEAVGFKNSIWDEREEIHKLLRHATKVLAERTKLLSLALSEEGDFYYCGIANILSFQEFLEEERLSAIFERFEDDLFWSRMFKKLDRLQEELMVFLGEEDIPDPTLHKLAGVLGEFRGKRI